MKRLLEDNNDETFVCKKCGCIVIGYMLDDFGSFLSNGAEQSFEYCPGCGVKVKGVDMYKEKCIYLDLCIGTEQRVCPHFDCELYEPERVCYIRKGCCSVCGESGLVEGKTSYCSNCGSRVKKIEACPFCGGAGKLFCGEDVMGIANYVYCMECEATGPTTYSGVDAAIAKWNREG